MNALKCLVGNCRNVFPAVVQSSNACISKYFFSSLQSQKTHLLVPETVSIIPSCGMKVKGFIRRRCKDCYFVRRDGRLYVMCHSFPRHKQTHIVKKEKFTWIMSHACMSKQRPY